jgi:hypothetical protein
MTAMPMKGLFMRNKNRIREIMSLIEIGWKQFPDWRFGQYMCNLLGALANKRGADVFYIEDDEHLIKDILEIYIDWNGISDELHEWEVHHSIYKMTYDTNSFDSSDDEQIRDILNSLDNLSYDAANPYSEREDQ